ncbi:CoA-transferase subunit beta [Halobacteriales archaeon Cl-PHB]
MSDTAPEETVAGDYNMAELMIVAGSRQLRNDDLAIIGTGMPFLAAQLAKEYHAPDMTIVVEGGQYDANPSHVPYTVGDACLTPGAGMTGMLGMAGVLLRNELDVGFIGGAQVDKYGNLNSTVIGEDYHDPAVRLPGSGGASPIAAHCKRTIVMMPQERRRFVEDLDFLTSVGYLDGDGSREDAGLPPGGPAALVSDMGVYSFDDTGEMVLESAHPGISVDEVREAVEWDLQVGDDVGTTSKPTESEVSFLRELDNEGFFLRRQEFLEELSSRADALLTDD